MAQNIVNQGPLPVPSAKAQQRRQANKTADKFTKGIALPFPWLSTKGKKWTLNRGEQSFQFEKNRVPQPIEIVLADSSPYTQKAYFEGGYQEGANRKPDCASNDGFKPYVPLEQQKKFGTGPTCDERICTKARMGSAPTVSAAGKRPGKACKDVRVLAVVLEFDLEALDIGPISLRLPFTSHAPLADYIGVLDRMPGGGYDPDQVVSRAYFDPDATHQVVKYEFVRALTDEELDTIEEMKRDGRTTRITGSTFDYLANEPGEETAAPGYDNSLSAKVAETKTTAETTPEPKAEPAPPVVTDEVPAEPVEEAPVEVEEPVIPPTWAPISGQTGVYFAPEKGGLVNADGSPWAPPVEKKPEPFQPSAPPPQGAARQRRVTAGSTPKTKAEPVSLTQVTEPKANGSGGKIEPAGDDLMSLMNKLMDKKS